MMSELVNTNPQPVAAMLASRPFKQSAAVAQPPNGKVPACEQAGYAALLISPLLLIGCSSNNADYFPLSKGASWTYERSLNQNDETSRSKFSMQSLGTERWQDKTVAIREDSDGNRYALLVGPTAIERVARKSLVQAELEADAKPLTVLKVPLTKGATWTTPSVPHVLRRVADFPPELKYSHKINLEFEVMALDATVETPAGKFSNCAHVQGRASLKLYVDPVAGFSDIPITQDEWYCPGVGLAKLHRQEPVKSRFLIGGDLKLTLSDYTMR
jgi:hypothetical protein